MEIDLIPSPKRLACGYIVPKSRVGATEPTNTAASRMRCNHREGKGWGKKRTYTRGKKPSRPDDFYMFMLHAGSTNFPHC